MHRVWSELASYETLGSPRTLDLLERHRLFALVAVQPQHLPDLPALLERFAARKIELGLWPMLADHEGRWFNRRNAARFRQHTESVLEMALPSSRSTVKEIALDLEPHIEEMRAFLSWRPSFFAKVVRRGDSFLHTKKLLGGLVDEIRARGLRALAAVMPPIALPHGERWERRFGTPVRELAWDHVSVMAYTSMIEGWSKGTLQRRHAVAALDRLARETKRAFGERGGISLGAVGIGAFGNEPIYRSVSELEEDVVVARDRGIGDLTLFELAGVLSRPHPEAWLSALGTVTSRGAAPASSLRVSAAIGVLDAIPNVRRLR